MKASLFIFMVTVLIYASPKIHAETNCSFSCTYKAHLKAIQDRDFVSFDKTLPSKNELTLILPNGKLSTDLAQYKQLIQGWFKQNTWQFNYQIKDVIERDNFGSVLLEVNYQQVAEDKTTHKSHYYLYLLFEKFEGRWQLLHDQNTLIK